MVSGPGCFEEAVAETDIRLTLRMQERYDHSYYFISTFMDDHLRWHAEDWPKGARETGGMQAMRFPTC